MMTVCIWKEVCFKTLVLLIFFVFFFGEKRVILNCVYLFSTLVRNEKYRFPSAVHI